MKVAHIIGNGDQAVLYEKEPRKGIKIVCNQTPFDIPDKYVTAMVDFKFMNALKEGTVKVNGQWILGYRPKIWMEKNQTFYMKHASQIKEFHTELPKYACLNEPNNIGQGYTNWNCGHLATHYACTRVKAEEVHMYGFDSIFDFNLRSYSDLVLNSDREGMNTNRLAGNWRPIWEHFFRQFKDVKFILHHIHDAFKIKVPDNVSVRVYKK